MNKTLLFCVLAFLVTLFSTSVMGVEIAEQPTQTAIRLKRVTPISLVSVDSLSTATAETAAATGADGTTASTNHANSITLSTYIFVLLTVLSCMVGSVFSFICCKLVNNDRKI